MTYDSTQVIGAEGLTFDELASIGCVPGVEAPASVVRGDGVELRVHPDAVLRDERDLGEIVDLFTLYGPEHTPQGAWNDWSAWQHDAWMTMRSAYVREERRRIEAKR